MPNFKLVPQYLFWWPVTARVPDPEKAGEFIEQAFEMQFEALPLEEVNASERKSREFNENGDFAAGETHLLARVSKGWRDVEDEHDEPVAFTPDALREAMRFPYFRTAVYRAYIASLSGEKPRLGN